MKILCFMHKSLCSQLPPLPAGTHGDSDRLLTTTQGTLAGNFSSSQWPWGPLSIDANIKPLNPPTESDRAFLTQWEDCDRQALFLSEFPGSPRRMGVGLHIDWRITVPVSWVCWGTGVRSGWTWVTICKWRVHQSSLYHICTHLKISQETKLS